MKVGKLISMFVVNCLLSLGLAVGANVNAQTENPQLRKTSEMQEKNQKTGKKKHHKREHKKSHHHHS